MLACINPKPIIFLIGAIGLWRPDFLKEYIPMNLDLLKDSNMIFNKKKIKVYYTPQSHFKPVYTAGQY